MLSSEEIKNISFGRARFGGYKAKEVDEFLDDLQVSYDELLRKNRNLTLTVQKLEGEIKKFQSEESSIKDVIVSLKEITEKSLSDAGERAKQIISDASKTSEKMIINARKEVCNQNDILARLKNESIKLKKQLESIYQKHMEIIRDIPGKETCFQSNLNHIEKIAENFSDISGLNLKG